MNDMALEKSDTKNDESIESGTSNSIPPNRLDAHAREMGLMRIKADLRQIGALLMVLGMGAYFSALALKAELITGMNGNDQVEGFKLALLISAVLQTFLGMVAAAMGFVTTVLTPKNKLFHILARSLVFVVNLGFISLVISIIRLSQGANAPPEYNDYIPLQMGPTQADIRFVAAMGILSLFSVCSTLIGGLTILSLTLSAYLGNRAIDKNKGYYIVRYAYYNLLVILGGCSEMALGSYLMHRFGTGIYDEPVHIAVYTVFVPSLTVLVGTVQCLVGTYGWCRAVGWMKMGGVTDNRFLWASCFSWLVTTAIQIIAQPSYAKGHEFTSEGATVSAVYMGTFIMLPYMDYLIRHTPIRIAPEYFGLSPDTPEHEDKLAKVFGLTSRQMLLKKREIKTSGVAR